MWQDLAVQCAPNVAPATIEAIIQVEAGGKPLALHVNGARVQPFVPNTLPAVAELAKEWIAKGFTVDLGLMQVNSANLPKLGLTVEQVLSPCTNINAGAAILAAGYAQAVKVHGEGQEALKAALSAYNTGNLQRGFRNGYVARYYGPIPAVSENNGKNTKIMHNPYSGLSAVVWPEVPDD